MADWKTYVGFFQSGEVDSTDESGAGRTTYFDNFFPVMEKIGERFEHNFPHPDFSYGKLQLKRKHQEHGTQANIMLKEISADIEHNTLVAVSFDVEKFVQGKDFRYVAIVLESEEDVRAAIKIEKYKFEDIFGKKLKALVPLESLDIAANHGTAKKNLVAIVNTPLAFPSFPCVIANNHTISNEITAKISSGFSKTIPWFDSSSVSSVVDVDEGVIDGTKVPYYVHDSWEYDGYTSVEEIELVELQESAVRTKGKLEFSSNKYVLKSVEKGVAAVSPATTRGLPEESATSINIVDRITQFLRDSGRDVSKADVINYCICITQGFITTFAGAPGTGKTTLCRLLAKAIGLQEEDGEYDSDARYAEISVERGWTSLKDFIGYPNPFPTINTSGVQGDYSGSDDIIASNVDACNAFRRMNEKWDAETGTKPPYFMLLDEANLSPIEYYWSQFLRNCQMDDAEELDKRKINVSQKASWKISPNLRFLATVNFDHTTEELSPRFLDRSWVIPLKAPDGMLPKGKPSMPTPICMQDLQNLFGYPTESEMFPAAIQGIWDQIQQIFRAEDVNMPLSPRNTLAVENYCIAAARFEETEITPHKALDFAILQKILPTISGYGNRCETLVNGLCAIAREHQLLDTVDKLEEMSVAAEANSQFYQFFVR